MKAKNVTQLTDEQFQHKRAAYIAAHKGKVAQLEKLLKNKEGDDNLLRELFGIAIHAGHSNIIQFLLDKNVCFTKINVEGKNIGSSELVYAFSCYFNKGHDKILDLVMQKLLLLDIENPDLIDPEFNKWYREYTECFSSEFLTVNPSIPLSTLAKNLVDIQIYRNKIFSISLGRVPTYNVYNEQKFEAFVERFRQRFGDNSEFIYYPLIFFMRYLNKSQLDILVIIERDASPSLASNEARMISSILRHKIKRCEALLQNPDQSLRVNPNQGDVGQLHFAAYMGYLDICKLLLKNGAHLNGSENGEIPLIGAAMKGHYDVCKFLLEEKADVNLLQKEEYYSYILPLSIIITRSLNYY